MVRHQEEQAWLEKNGVGVLMPVKPLKPCEHPRCPRLVQSGRFCDNHKPDSSDTRDSSSKRGYDRTWEKVRRVYLANKPVCEICGEYRNLEVHHIKPIKQGGERLSLSNLKTLCHDCHNKTHHRYIKSKDKAAPIDPETGLRAV
jgi:5-methylcytosine-specific restriction protein A